MDLYFDQNGQPIKIVDNKFRYYEGAAGDNQLKTNRSSGAYIFRPNEQRTYPYGHVVESILYVDDDYHLYIKNLIQILDRLYD
ncbi:hypothetical protein BLA29_013369 [Euroglyphus maynei]|uniref:Uncharacterized protein n=1 Tax=Euroglyphus maynei TaxID=6958 RepID=A0A1Y3AQ73_EURMA|nr:hypothetical protein BLA29_013369 [Euroglyphus maynei]